MGYFWDILVLTQYKEIVINGKYLKRIFLNETISALFSGLISKGNWEILLFTLDELMN